MTFGDFLFFALMVAIVFVLKGDPSLWDVWHAQLLKGCK